MGIRLRQREGKSWDESMDCRGAGTKVMMG